MKFSTLPQPVDVLELMQNFPCPVTEHVLTDLFQTWYNAKHD